MNLARTIAALVLLLAAYGCSKGDSEQSREQTRTALVAPENALSEELMISLGQARNFHHKADVLLADGKTEEAAEAVMQILNIPFPADAPESEEALLDTRARLGKLQLELGKVDEALQTVDEGIASATRRSFFLANLHTVRGELFEAKAKSQEAGSPEAKAFAVEAIKALDTSIEINNELLKRLHLDSQNAP